LIDVVGMGGMGIVYVAYDRKLDRKVALKLLRPDIGAAGEARARLLREAQLVARLSHPNIITVHDVGEFAGQIYIDMEFVEGCTLREWLADRARPVAEIVRVFLDAARGLAAAHMAGVIHRDFKPDNVLIGVDGRVRVNDFGLARTAAQPELPSLSMLGAIRAPRSEFETRTNVQVGTPAYMAPEQRRGEATTPAADQYAFCVALHEALAGERPAVDRPDRVRDGRIAEVLRRGLSADPQDRFPAMEGLIAALSQVTRRRRWPAFLAAGVVALGLGLRVAATREEASACLDAQQYAAGVWGEARKEAVRRAFVATGAPGAEQSFAAVVQAVERTASAWTAAHGEACEAFVRGEQSAELLDRRMACLRRSLGELDSTLDVLAEADAMTVERGAQMVGTVSSPEQCGAIEVLQASVPLPPPALRARVEAHGDRVARVNALEYAGRHKEATALAEALVREAAALEFAPSEMTATYALGRAQMVGSAFAAAEASFKRTWMLAETLGLDGSAIDALTSLTWNAVARGMFAEAELWSDLAGAKLNRLGESGWGALARRAALSQWRGELYLGLGRLDEAEAAYREALALRRRDPKAVPQAISSSLNSLGNLAITRGDFAASMTYLREALAIREREFGPHSPRVAGTLNNIGRVLMTECRWDEARAHFDRALAIRRALYGEEHTEISAVLSNVAELEEALGRPEEALAAAERSLAITRRFLGERHALLVPDLVALSRLRRAQGEAAEALELAERAREIQGPRAGETMLAIGEALLALGRVDEAVATLEQAWPLFHDDPGIDVWRARAAFALARALAARGEPERAAQAAGWALAAMPRCHEDETRRIAAWSAAIMAAPPG
jgi:tetratricopeptide (TPR) repeat protein